MSHKMSANAFAPPATGQPPARTLPLSVPVLAGNEWKYLKECLDTGWVSSVGPFVDRFEREIAAATGSPHAVAMMNGTAALHLALQLIGVGPGDEVLVPTLTFIAPVNAVRYCGAEPVFMDADPATWQLDADKAARFLAEQGERRGEATINRRTGRRLAAIVPVHLLGLACDMDRVLAFAQRHRLPVVEDAAEAMGVRFRGRHVGTFGDIGVLSFNGNKVITSGGGGMLLTASGERAARARSLSTQAKDDGQEYVHREVGYNYRLTNLQAALGVAQLEQLERFLARKRDIARWYAEGLRDLDGVSLMPTSPDTEATYWLYTILLRPGTTVAQRRAVVARLEAEGIGARPLWHPIHDLPPYRDCEAVDITCAPDLYARAISLPSSPTLTEEDVRACCESVRRALA